MGIFSWIKNRFKKKSIENKRKLVSDLLSPQKFFRLETTIGYAVKEKQYFIQALTHRSFLEQNEYFDKSNERLEFLGDAVLNLVVAKYLYDNFPDEDEGFLTKVRAKLVNRNTLANAADSINLSDFLLVSRNLTKTINNGAKTILCDAFEAVIGAIYLDNGLRSSKKFIERVLIEPNSREGIHLKDENYKSQLLEYAQANKLPNPVYEVVNEEGPQHNRVFTINAVIDDENVGTGKGRNKKSAEQKAAQAALKKIKQ